MSAPAFHIVSSFPLCLSVLRSDFPLPVRSYPPRLRCCPNHHHHQTLPRSYCSVFSRSSAGLLCFVLLPPVWFLNLKLLSPSVYFLLSVLGLQPPAWFLLSVRFLLSEPLPPVWFLPALSPVPLLVLPYCLPWLSCSCCHPPVKQSQQ